MLQFHIQQDSDIPASRQLLDQIQFAIASGQYPPGHRLPSTRQLAMITGLHRNTISKVYRQLEEIGLVESLAGSGIYVKVPESESAPSLDSPIEKYPDAKRLLQESIDELLSQGCNLSQVKEILLNEIDWRLRCSAQVVLTVPHRDIFAGEIMQKELAESLQVPVQLVILEELSATLKEIRFATVVTSRYFIGEVLKVIPVNSVRVVPVDIYDYAQELEIVKGLPKDACVGLVSLSAGTLEVAETIVHSLRGDDLLIVTAQASDSERLKVIIRTAKTIICDPASYPLLKQSVLSARDEYIRPPEVICSQNYISEKSIDSLKQELGLAIST